MIEAAEAGMIAEEGKKIIYSVGTDRDLSLQLIMINYHRSFKGCTPERTIICTGVYLLYNNKAGEIYLPFVFVERTLILITIFKITCCYRNI